MKAKPWIWCLLGIIFIGPILLSWLMFFYHLGPEKTNNRGQLIHPAFSIKQLNARADSGLPAEVALAHKWSILLVDNGRCGSACQQRLHAMRQISIATGKDLPRVMRALITPTEATVPIPKSTVPTVHLSVKPKQFQHYFSQHNDSLYIIDPQGFFVLHYPLQKNKPEDVYKDLKRLLRTSRIG